MKPDSSPPGDGEADRGGRVAGFELRVPDRRSGERLDRFVAEALLEQHGARLSRRAVRRAIEAGAIWVGGKRVRIASRAVETGQRVEARLDPTSPPTAGEPPRLEDRVLYEDAYLIAIDKPAGLPSQATPEDVSVNAVEGVRRLLGRRTGGRRTGGRRTGGRRTGAGARSEEEPYVALHHRLDRGTSGILLLAKHRRANPGLARAFAAASDAPAAKPAGGMDPGGLEKAYEVLVHVPGEHRLEAGESFVIELGLEPRGGRKVAVVADGGLRARTEVRVLVVGEGAARLEARPATGRKHQIRAHLEARGLPVCGDRLYGGSSRIREAPRAPRPMLHASRLVLPHPVSGELLRLECPPPADFERLATLLGLVAPRAGEKREGSALEGGAADRELGRIGG
ncbi:MAG: RluA family pseudouridine synthase [Holophagales bacterium]|nr:RluA family pseudouridine synthase [Holophagales bacterium]